MTIENDPLRIYMIAGEPSGDALGGRLIEALQKDSGRPIALSGIGGERMTEAGLASLFPMTDLTVMGLVEVLPRLPLLLRRIRETTNDILEKRPDVVVTIDAPDFCFRVAKKLQGRGIPIVHYVAPSVWAWRPGRAKKVARLVDHIMCLLPFEPPYFEREGLPATFVGHPILESPAGAGDGAAFRERHGIAPEAKLLCLLPGSRHSETGRLLPVFEDTVAQVCQKVGDFQVVVPTVPGVAEAVRAGTATWQNTLVVLGEAEKYDAFAAADAALAASGTVSLELAMARTPAIIAYKVAPFTAFLAKRLLTIRYASIVNLILDREAVPELIQEKCTADNLAPAIAGLLSGAGDGDGQLADIESALNALRSGEATPSEAAADVVRTVAGHKKNAAP